MDACIFMMTVNSLMPVYAADLTTQVDQLSINDKVCVTRIEHGWTEVHFSRGNIGHTGYLQDLKVQQPAQPAEPVARDEPYEIPAPAPAPDQHSQYRGPAPSGPILRPAALAMNCYPEDGRPYAVVYVNGHAATFAASGFKREYPVIDEHDDQSNHVFYVAMKRGDQDRTVYLALDYSQRGNDVSALVTQVAGGHKAKDKCSMNWEITK